MPRRWLSIRDRKEETRPALEGCDGFDFAFTTRSGVAASPAKSPDAHRPFTSGADGHRAKRKPDLSLLIERPPMSRGSLRHHAPHSAEQPESPHIGIAFGSPRNPPQNFPALGITMTPSRNCFADDSFPSRSPSTRKWKKIGGLFKPRSNSDKGLPLTHPQHIGVESHKLGLPIHRTPWRNPKSPPNAHHAFREHPAFAKSENRDRAMTLHDFDSTNLEKFLEDNPIPSLRVRIPGSPLDRYSVMFKNVSASPQLGPEGRRIQCMEGTTTDSTATHEAIRANQPQLQRRVTSPTDSRTVDRPRTASQTASSNRYSLFPSTPTTSRPQSQHRHSTQPQSRPSTAPNQTVPLPGGFPSPPKRDRNSTSPTNLQESPRKELPCPLPLATVEIRDTCSHSRGSSAGEIFFDVKSFRDSQGQDVNQYEMTRPPSAELQLARSKSNARKQLQKRPNVPTQLTGSPDRPTKTTSAEIDETIALVESLTSASASTTHSNVEERRLRQRQVTDEKQKATAPLAVDVDTIPIKKVKRKSIKERSEALSIAVPSPVLECTEEATPRTIELAVPRVTAVVACPSVKMNHIASRATSAGVSVSRTRSRKDSSSPPPAVPVKDSKFIPLSKYASKQTAQTLVRQTGLRPVRSNTDDGVSYNNRPAISQRQIPLGRSQTMPSLNGARSTKQVMSPPILAGPEAPTRCGRDMPMVVAYVKPSAEVSVARTVSLSRRPRTKIMVSRQPSRSGPNPTNRSEEEVTEKKVAERLPVLQEVQKKHKPGLSQDGVLEVVDLTSSRSPPPMPSIGDFAKALEGFPTPPTSAT